MRSITRIFGEISLGQVAALAEDHIEKYTYSQRVCPKPWTLDSGMTPAIRNRGGFECASAQSEFSSSLAAKKNCQGLGGRETTHDTAYVKCTWGGGLGPH
ncbi:expressed unknown protein [Seminavis robusta]|uniref:Uncharacterized protein n=1 Tax=Seminavis robusta TaxID=568900 RepID=A0A9N8DMY0_9STRA|nr:expressed unknown protein [Seminavis robusta]|eukprot:Sro249_g098750.1 n/a (100) ;mRNA; r:54180-54559